MREDAKQALKHNLTQYVESITAKSKYGKYICPLCGSGTGANKSGAFSIGDKKTHWECFSCGKGGDLFDLIGAIEGLPTLPAQMGRAEALFGMGLPDINLIRPAEMLRNVDAKTAEDPAEQAQERADLIERAKQDISKTDYWKKRGFSEETVIKYGVGFVERWRLNPNTPYSPRLILSTSKTSYLARDTRDNLTETEREFRATPHNVAFNKLEVDGGKKRETEGKLFTLAKPELDRQAKALVSQIQVCQSK